MSCICKILVDTQCTNGAVTQQGSSRCRCTTLNTHKAVTYLYLNHHWLVTLCLENWQQNNERIIRLQKITSFIMSSPCNFKITQIATNFTIHLCKTLPYFKIQNEYHMQMLLSLISCAQGYHPMLRLNFATTEVNITCGMRYFVHT